MNVFARSATQVMKSSPMVKCMGSGSQNQLPKITSRMQNAIQKATHDVQTHSNKRPSNVTIAKGEKIRFNNAHPKSITLPFKTLEKLCSTKQANITQDMLPSPIQFRSIGQKEGGFPVRADHKPCTLIFGSGEVAQKLSKLNQNQPTINVSRQIGQTIADNNLSSDLSKELSSSDKEILAQEIATVLIRSNTNHLNVVNSVGEFTEDSALEGPNGEALKKSLENSNLNYHTNVLDIVQMAVDLVDKQENTTQHHVSVVTMGSTYLSREQNNPHKVFSKQKEDSQRLSEAKGFSAIMINTGPAIIATAASTQEHTPDAVKNCQTVDDIVENIQFGLNCAQQHGLSIVELDTYRFHSSDSLKSIAKQELEIQVQAKDAEAESLKRYLAFQQNRKKR
jgi:hypothetical protein